MAFDRRETALLLVGDFLMLVLSLWIALLLRNFSVPSLGYFEANVTPFLPVFLLSLLVFYIAGLYEKQTRPIRRSMGPRIFGALSATVAIAAILFFVLPLTIAPKTILILYLGTSVIVESVWRFYRMSREMKEEERVPALLVGSGPAVQELLEEVRGNGQYLIRFVSHHETTHFSETDISEAVAGGMQMGVRLVIIDISDPAVARTLPMLYSRMAEGITFRSLASLYEEIFDRVPLAHNDTTQLLEALARRRTFYDLTKRVFDILLAAVLSVITLPVILVAALLIVLTGGTPFIRHERIGQGGRLFHILKLRSMLFNDYGDPELQKKNRVTALGRVLRRTRIDELPQLWNVLEGTLSFIGPRPEIPKIAEVYERDIPLYRVRHLIPPGLSGWAQILDYDAPRGGADVARTRRKLSFDLYYLKHRSFGLDLAIATKTIRALLSFSGS